MYSKYALSKKERQDVNYHLTKIKTNKTESCFGKAELNAPSLDKADYRIHWRKMTKIKMKNEKWSDVTFWPPGARKQEERQILWMWTQCWNTEECGRACICKEPRQNVQYYFFPIQSFSFLGRLGRLLSCHSAAPVLCLQQLHGARTSSKL